MAYPWSAGDQLNAADLNAIVQSKQLKKNSGGPISTSSVNLDTVSITGLNASDILVVHYSFFATGGTQSGALTLLDSTNSVSLGDIGNTTSGVSLNFAVSGTAIVSPRADDATSFLMRANYGSVNTGTLTDNTSRDRYVISTGHTGGFTGTWTLALNKGTDVGTSATYWRWHVYKLFN